MTFHIFVRYSVTSRENQKSGATATVLTEGLVTLEIRESIAILLEKALRMSQYKRIEVVSTSLRFRDVQRKEIYVVCA
jgi:hypothetical protein